MSKGSSNSSSSNINHHQRLRARQWQLLIPASCQAPWADMADLI
jgi:hypothetical protein